MANKRVLNLYAGVGGNRKDWKDVDVTAVESDPKIAAVYQKLYPEDTVVVGDAKKYLVDNYKDFDMVWASPPCQKHSRMIKATRHDVADYPDFGLYEIITFLDNFFTGEWVVENVVPYYAPLILPTVKVGRHLFWSSRYLYGLKDVKRPKGFINKSSLAGKKQLQDWLGIHFDERLYYGNNHCPCQVLRNCVHPALGLQIYEALISPDAVAAKTKDILKPEARDGTKIYDLIEQIPKDVKAFAADLPKLLLCDLSDTPIGEKGLVSHILNEVIEVERLQKAAEEQENELDQSVEVADLQHEVKELERRANITADNLREETILERFGEIFADTDYRRIEAMLDTYELL